MKKLDSDYAFPAVLFTVASAAILTLLALLIIAIVTEPIVLLWTFLVILGTGALFFFWYKFFTKDI